MSCWKRPTSETLSECCKEVADHKAQLHQQGNQLREMLTRLEAQERCWSTVRRCIMLSDRMDARGDAMPREERQLAASPDSLSFRASHVSLLDLQSKLDETISKVLEHERCDRVLLCDVLPKLGELSDARDEVCRALASMEQRLAKAEADVRQFFSSQHEATTAGRLQLRQFFSSQHEATT